MEYVLAHTRKALRLPPWAILSLEPAAVEAYEQGIAAALQAVGTLALDAPTDNSHIVNAYEEGFVGAIVMASMLLEERILDRSSRHTQGTSTKKSKAAKSSVLACMQQMEAQGYQYDVAAIVKLLGDAYRAQDLRLLCQTEQRFKPILKDLPPEAGLAKIIQVLVEFCEKHLLIRDLLAEVHDFNPAQFERYKGRLFILDRSRAA